MQGIIFLCLGTLLLAIHGHTVSKISVELNEQLKTLNSMDIIVKMQGGNSAALQQAKFSGKMTTLEVRANTVSNFLQSHALKSQASLHSFLSQQDSVSFKSFWVNNVVFVRSASRDLIKAIALRDDVESVNVNTRIKLIQPEFISEVENRDFVNEWGVEKIQAPEVWAAGYNGTGVRIAIIDTGTRGTHAALVDSYIGTNGWYDPVDGSDTPEDLADHGTHVMGTIVGANGIGVAPGAKWLSCNGLSGYWEGTAADAIACGQWIICPTLPDGTSSPDCDKTPHVVANSWGFYREEDDEAAYAEVIDAWHAIGIIPIFAMGNSGPECETGIFPGGQDNVIAVGATDVDNYLASFSSRGPSNFNRTFHLKPDISAPGVDVRSCSNKEDNGYAIMSGTSMACPHVTGVAALLLSINNALTYEELRELLITHTTIDLKPTGDNCHGTGDDDWPNNSFGYGLVNAFKAVTALKVAKAN